jgi:hypothetical protein
MALGPGKYDAEVSELRKRLKAHGILLLVLDGERGSGFSAQLPLDVTMNMPTVLRDLANEIETSGIRA